MFVFIRTILFALAGLALAILAGVSGLKGDVSVSAEPVATTTGVSVPHGATSTPTVATTTAKIVPTKTATSTVTKPIAKAPPVPKPTVTPTKEPIAPTTTPGTELVSNIPPSSIALNERVRASIVNIICVTKASGPLNSISASGVMIDPRGVIITNSHVGQYFLLKDYPSPDFVQCVIRTGSPAQPKYTAELLFLPPSWIADNAQKINQSKPTGNGEHDYAFLRITGTVSSSVTLPAAFPFLPIAINPPSEGQTMLAAGYPAGFLGGITVQRELYAASAITHVGDVFTFNTDTLDLFSLGGSIVAQQGASGGAVTNEDGVLMGIVVTATDAPDTASRDLRAIATSYIIRDFQKEAGTPIDTYLQGDIETEAHTFALTTAPTLTQRLVNVIEGH
ncbi:MAG: serine protease [Patescibacteria group bacterium]